MITFTPSIGIKSTGVGGSSIFGIVYKTLSAKYQTYTPLFMLRHRPLLSKQHENR